MQFIHFEVEKCHNTHTINDIYIFPKIVACFWFIYFQFYKIY